MCAAAAAFGSRPLGLLIQPQTRDALEMAQVVRDQGQVMGKRRCGDEEIGRGQQLALPAQQSANPTEVPRDGYDTTTSVSTRYITALPAGAHRASRGRIDIRKEALDIHIRPTARG
jgi:hypothetical protein